MKKQITLKNLDCANCANKIEIELGKYDFLQKVNVNFSTLKLTFEIDEKDIEKIESEVYPKIMSLEPEIEIIEDLNKKESNFKKINYAIIRLIIGSLLIFIGYIMECKGLNQATYAYIIGSAILLFRTLKNAWKLLIKNKTINENFLISISVIGAFLVGEQMEGAMVIFLYEIGKILEEKAINKTRKSVSDLMNIKPEYANLKNDNDYIVVTPEDVKVGDVIIIKQGERIPLDGVIVSGKSELDVSALTGESGFKKVEKNQEVLSGSINIDGILEVKVTKLYEDSTVSKILELVENASDKKAKTETVVSKGARYYTLIVIILAAIFAIYTKSIYKALICLVISCPCAIAISVPLSYFSGIGKASKEGILIKGSNYLDALKSLKEIVFDKTGTITTGGFNVTKINVLNNKYDQKQVLDYIAKAENFSNHPIAKSVLKEIDYDLDISLVKNYKEVSGKGLTYDIENKNIKVGKLDFVTKKEIEKVDEEGTIVYISIDNELIGNIVIKDKIKKCAIPALKMLKDMNIKTRIFTGDNKKIAQKIANEIGVNEVKAEMLPQDKYDEMEKLISLYKNTNSKVAFVGDGINDSPVLALSDLGISMGGVGQVAAIEASDVVIMTDDLEKIVEAIKISRKTNKIITQNLIFAIGVKVLILIFALLEISGMWEAIFADVGVTLLTILNTLRILK